RMAGQRALLRARSPRWRAGALSLADGDRGGLRHIALAFARGRPAQSRLQPAAVLAVRIPSVLARRGQAASFFLARGLGARLQPRAVAKIRALARALVA